MEFVHVLVIAFIVIIGYLFLVRNKGGVRDIGVGSNRALYSHMSIIKEGVVYRPINAKKTQTPGLYNVEMYEIRDDRSIGESMHHSINVNDFTVRFGLALVPGELVAEESFDSVAELMDPVLKQRRDEEITEFLEGLEYKELERQVKDAEAGERDLKRTITTVRSRLLDYVKLLKKQHEDYVQLDTKYQRALSLLKAYGEAPEVINELVVAKRELAQKDKLISELRAGETATMEMTKAMIGQQGSGQDLTVVKT